MIKKLVLLIPAALFFLYCGSYPADQSRAKPINFNEYWYQGLAEVNSFALEQSRYGQVFDGEAVMIFVTEDFSAKRQVKLDYSGNKNPDLEKVLKLNFSRKFETGIYDYSVLQSVFTPVSFQVHRPSLKSNTSIQEWCGHTFNQFNLQKNKYRFSLLSYFGSEGDMSLELPAVLLEDELWNMIRMRPDAIPTGTVEIIPGSVFNRFYHQQPQVHKATILIEEIKGFKKLSLDYTHGNRKLEIFFEKEFPHKIESWTEEITIQGKPMKTSAKRKKTMLIDYWNKNSPADESFRKELMLTR